MKKHDNELDTTTSSKKTNNRRKVLKKAGVAGSAAAVAAWSKPSLYSVVTPAHAQMSDDMTPPPMMAPLAGATAATPVVMLNNGKNDSIAGKVLDAIVPEAHAGAAQPRNVCAAFTQNGNDDYRHCVEITLDAAEDDTDFTMTVTGPMVYYNYCFYSDGYSYTYYEGKSSFGGSTMDTLNGKDISVIIAGIEYTGTVADDFMSASGTLSPTGFNSFSVGSNYNGTNANCSYDSSAYWNAGGGGSCTYGAGADISRGNGMETTQFCFVNDA